MRKNNNKNEYKHRDVRLVTAKAKELMFSGENHLLLIFSLIIIGVTLMLPQIFFSLIYTVFPYLIVDIALIVCICIITMPLLVGLLSMVSRLADGEKFTVADLFEPLSSFGAWIRSIWIMTVFLIVTAAEAFLLYLPVLASESMIGAGVSKWVSYPAITVCILGILFGVLLLNCRMLPFLMLTVNGEGAFKAIGRSFSLTKGKTFRLLGYKLCFLPLFVVSIVAVLVPMLIYTAPLMLCVYAIGVKMMCENNNE